MKNGVKSKLLTPGVMLQGCICRGRKGQEDDWNRGGCKEGKKIPLWLPKGEQLRADASSGAEGEGGC